MMSRESYYDRVAGVYDVLSAERLLYRRPRERAVHLLRVSAGDTVLDVGCGTGLSFPALQRTVGPTGMIVGLDASAGMLARAQERTRRARWGNVRLIHAPAADLSTALLRSAGVDPARIDAAVAAYVLSVIDDWQASWEPASDRTGVRAARRGGGPRRSERTSGLAAPGRPAAGPARRRRPPPPAVAAARTAGVRIAHRTIRRRPRHRGRRRSALRPLQSPASVINHGQRTTLASGSTFSPSYRSSSPPGRKVSVSVDRPRRGSMRDEHVQ